MPPKQKVQREVKTTKPSEARASRSKSVAKPDPKSASRKSKSVQPQSKATKSKRSVSSDHESDDQFQFKEDQFVAFLSKEDIQAGEQNITIGKMVKNVLSDDTTLQLVVFKAAKSGTQFTRKDQQEIMTVQVIAAVDTEKETKTAVTLTKKSIQEVERLLKRMFDQICEAVNEKSDEEASRQADEDANKEESEDEEESPILQPRVKGKRKAPSAQTQAVNKSAPVKGAKATGRQVQIPKTKSNAKKDESEEDSDFNADEIKANIGKKRAMPKNLTSSQPTASRKKKLNDDGDSDEEEEAPKKVPAKKPVKKPTEFKLGKWNPNTVIVPKKDEIERYGLSDTLGAECCIVCNCRNMVRAVETDNAKLLAQCVQAKEKIPDLGQPWGPECQHLNPLEMILKKQSLPLLKALFDIKVNSKADRSQYNEAAAQIFNRGRCHVRPTLLQTINTGKVSYSAYGANIRQVQATRGNRQGNQAFIRHFNTQNPLYIMNMPYYWRLTTPEIHKHLELALRGSQDPCSHLIDVSLTANRDILIFAIEPKLKLENYGFNKLHIDALKLENLTEKYHTASITKKAANWNITPLHFAALNPSHKVLQTLIDQNNDFNVMDSQNNKPIHYAACNEKPGCLKILIDKGASVFDINMQKKNALHYAAINRRPENVKLLLENNLFCLKSRDRANKTAFVYALESGDIPTIKAFLDHSQGKIKMNTGQGIERMTPLMYAAALGDIELAQFLLSNKARVLGKDKYKRSPLTMACRNGHVRLASMLLQEGSDWDHQDSSANSPLHYAAANGFIEIINLLIKHGANVNHQNSWKVTPITIAMLNNHIGTVKRLLEEKDVDVNGKDDQGRTLLALALLNIEEMTCYDFVKYLLEKGADPNLGDTSKCAPLHILAAKEPQLDLSHGRTQIEATKELKRVQKVQSDLIDLLLSKGANLAQLNDNEKTPFEIALARGNINVLEKFSSQVSLNKSPSILHEFAARIFDARFSQILVNLLNQEQNLSSETMNTLDKQGFTPFLNYIKWYVEKLRNSEFTAKIRALVQFNALKRGQSYKSYEMTNLLLFTCQNDPGYQQAQNQYSVPEDKMNQLIEQYVEELITKPFIELLKVLCSKGADPHATVQKTSFYRELDEHKRHLETVKQDQNAVQEVQMQIDTSFKATTAEEKGSFRAKKRDEVVAEQGVMAKKKGISAALREFYAAKSHNPSFMKVNGKKIEVEYIKDYGLQNALHIIMRQPDLSMYKFLVDEVHIKYDESDFLGRNPFMVNVQIHSQKQVPFESVNLLLQKGIRFDLPDSNNRTPFLIFYEKHNINQANKMLEMGANICQMDDTGLYALKYALIRRQNEEITRLIEKGAKINQLDHKNRNLLHHAVNMSSATADATFETEQVLIDHGVDINHVDDRGRVPLHYAFVKIDKWEAQDQIDPIETVSSLCGCPGLKIEVADKWQKTPLHYAAQRGAAISTLYILQRGANLESKDIYQNTALGISILRKHFNYAILLIQKNANVCLPVYDEYPKRLAKQWRDAEKALRTSSENVEMECDDDEKPQDTGRDLFKKRKVKNLWDYDDEDDEESDKSESEDSEHEQNVFNQQNAFGINVMKKKTAMKARKVPRHMFGGFGMGNQISQPEVKENKDEVEKETPPRSCFRISIQNQQQGLAYLILDNKYDYMLAMQDSLDERKFNLVLTLLSKTADNTIVQRKNSDEQNLMHILAKNSNGGQMHILRRIYDQLRKRGVDCLATDALGCNALHYAVQTNCYDLCKILLDEGVDVNKVNKEGHSPLSLHMRGVFGATKRLRPVAGISAFNTANSSQAGGLFGQVAAFGQAAFGRVIGQTAQKAASPQKPQNQNPLQTESLFDLLARHKADMNHVYPEESLDAEKGYKCTIIINMIRHCAIDYANLRANILCLIEHGANLHTVDSDHKDVLMHSVVQNSENLVNLFLQNVRESSTFLKDNQDNNGRNIIHYVVQPMEAGSFENVKILKSLVDSGIGFNLSHRDKLGETPADLAKLQKSGVMTAALTQFISGSRSVTKAKPSPDVRTYTPAIEWPAQRFDPQADSQALLDEAEKRKVQELIDDKKDTYVPLDKEFHGQKQYSVYFEGEHPNRRAYDAYMIKIDLKNGYYGDYVFYKMQMIYDSNRELYIVLTRYGRIGEEGMHQRTPFPDLEEAKKEFHTIFKQKSSNEWATAHTNFEKHKKKYVLVKVNHQNIQHQDYLAPFDYENCPATTMEKRLRLLFEEISNVTMYRRCMTQMNIDQSQLPVSALKRETILEAEKCLNTLCRKLKELEEARPRGMFNRENLDENFDKIHKLYSDLSDLTSEFYQLIPMKETDYWAVRPLTHYNQAQQLRQRMDQLINIEYSCRLLLGALYQQTKINPVDYVYDCLQSQVCILEQGAEFNLIKQYIESTSDDFKQWKKFNVFKIQRKGEGERFEAFQHLDNKCLMFHGSQMSNFIGILSQGLRIAPPEAPTTGYMFGKGIYFADQFRKSANYAHGGHKTDLMLLCEVALGNQLIQYQQNVNMAKPPNGYDSVKAVGHRVANWKDKALTTPEGFKVPIGDTVSSEQPTEAQFNKAMSYQVKDANGNNHFGGNQWNWIYRNGNFHWPLQHNEYIVYNEGQVKIRYMVQFEK